MLFSDKSPIAAKEARLVAVAVSAALRCEYCIAAQVEFAKNDGATDEEIKAASQIAGLGGQRAGAESQLAQTLAGLGAQRGAARSRSAGEISQLGGQRGAALERLASNIAQLGGQEAAAQTGLGSQLADIGQREYSGRMGTSGTLASGGQQLYGMTTGAGQQLGQTGVQAAQQLSGLAGQLAGGQQQGAQAMSGYAATLPQLQQQDVSNLFNVGAMNRARNQAQLDLNYQNFVGQYNLPQQLMSGFANFLTGAGPLAGGTGYSGTAQMTPFGQTGYAGYGNKGGQPDKLKPINPEKQKGLAALSKKAPDAVRQMGFNPVKAKRGGLASRFPMSSRKLGTA